MTVKPEPSDKTSESIAGRDLIPQPHGGALRRGNPGNRGRSLDGFRQRLQALVSDDDVLDYLFDCLRGVHGPKHAISAWQIATAQGYGPPPQRVEMRSTLASIDFSKLSDSQLARLVAGEHPWSVLGAGFEAGVAAVSYSATHPDSDADAE